MKDIKTRADLELLLKEFYTKLLQDESINYIFLDVAKIDLVHHLPILADFWEQVMFHTGSYRNNPMQIHLNLNAKEKLTEQQWNEFLDGIQTVFSKQIRKST